MEFVVYYTCALNYSESKLTSTITEEISVASPKSKVRATEELWL